MIITESVTLLESVTQLANVMVESGVRHSYPDKSEGKFHNKEIKEMIIHDNGNVFLSINGFDNDVTLPSLIGLVS